jgi:hypothetical protein
VHRDAAHPSSRRLICTLSNNKQFKLKPEEPKLSPSRRASQSRLGARLVHSRTPVYGRALSTEGSFRRGFAGGLQTHAQRSASRTSLQHFKFAGSLDRGRGGVDRSDKCSLISWNSCSDVVWNEISPRFLLRYAIKMSRGQARAAQLIAPRRNQSRRVEGRGFEEEERRTAAKYGSGHVALETHACWLPLFLANPSSNRVE